MRKNSVSIYGTNSTKLKTNIHQTRLFLINTFYGTTTAKHKVLGSSWELFGTAFPWQKEII